MTRRIVAILMLLLVPTLARAGVSVTENGVTFFYSDPSAASVHLAGAFNDWSASATPMTDEDGDGIWTVTLDLQAGEYEYKFVVNGGTWTADPDNPLVGGDFGNSILRVPGAGAAAPSEGPRAPARTGGTALPDPGLPSGTPAISNTSLHSRVFVAGFFRVLMDSVSELNDDPRFRLQRPQDQFNLDLTLNLNDRVWGSARLQATTGFGRAEELTTELYKAQANFIDEKFAVKGFYNEEVFATDEPFELLGHRDLRGTIVEEHIPFGQGTQGFTLSGDIGRTKLSLVYSDTFDEDIFNRNRPSSFLDQERLALGFNQTTGTDVLGLRALLPSLDLGTDRPLQFGLTYRGLLSDWWVNFTDPANPEPQEIQDYKEGQRDAGRTEAQLSNSFEIGNDFHTAAADFALGLSSSLRVVGAGGWSFYDGRWTLGDNERLVGASLENGAVDVLIGNENGYRGELGVQGQTSGFEFSVSHELRSFEGMDAGENYVAFRDQPITLLSDSDPMLESPLLSSYRNVNGTDGLSIRRFGPRPERDHQITEIDLAYESGGLRFELEADRVADDFAFADFLGSGAATFDRTFYRVSPRLTVRPFENKKAHFIALETQVLAYDDPVEMAQAGGSLLRLNSEEYILRGELPLPKIGLEDLSLRFDGRLIDYDGDHEITVENALTGEMSTFRPADSFFSPYVGIVYRPVQSVEVQVGYGVDPRFYNVIDPYGWDNGRQKFRDNWLLDRFLDRGAGDAERLDPNDPLNVLLAEQALEDQTQLVINALVNF